MAEVGATSAPKRARAPGAPSAQGAHKRARGAAQPRAPAQPRAAKPKRRRPPLAALPYPPHVAKRMEAQQALVTMIFARWLHEYLLSPDNFAATYEPRPQWNSQPRFVVLETRTDADGVVHVQPVFTEVCVGCGETKHALPGNFDVAHSNAQLQTCDPGREMYHNSPRHPCSQCFRGMRAAYRATLHGWVDTLVANYPLLRPVPLADGAVDEHYDATPLGWFVQRVARQGGEIAMDDQGKLVEVVRPPRCAISWVLLTLSGIGTAFCASINNLVTANKGAENHRPEDCELVAAELNVAQHDAIPCLKAAFDWLVAACLRACDQSPAARAGREAEDTAFIVAARRNWANSGNKRANGVTARTKKGDAASVAEYGRQCRERDLYTICEQMAAGHYAADKIAGRANNINAEDIYAMLLALPRCWYTGVLMTIANGHARFSVERLDNSIGHVVGNVVLCCRALNSSAGMTRAKWAHMVLSQDRVDNPRRVVLSPAECAVMEQRVAITAR